MMKKLLTVLVLMAIVAGAVVPILVQADTVSACEGRTPGYWKNHIEEWEGWGPGACFNHVFGVGPHQTLINVLNTGGGKWYALDRHAVAAILNATSSDLDFYDYSWVIQNVQDAYGTGNWEYYKDILEDANEMGVAGD